MTSRLTRRDLFGQAMEMMATVPLIGQSATSSLLVSEILRFSSRAGTPRPLPPDLVGSRCGPVGVSRTGPTSNFRNNWRACDTLAPNSPRQSVTRASILSAHGDQRVSRFEATVSFGELLTGLLPTSVASPTRRAPVVYAELPRSA